MISEYVLQGLNNHVFYATLGLSTAEQLHRAAVVVRLSSFTYEQLAFHNAELQTEYLVSDWIIDSYVAYVAKR